jgi:pentatricopeptide repeat protein
MKCLDKILIKGMVSWNAVIYGHAQNGCSEDVLRVFYKMCLMGMSLATPPLSKCSEGMY